MQPMRPRAAVLALGALALVVAGLAAWHGSPADAPDTAAPPSAAPAPAPTLPARPSTAAQVASAMPAAPGPAAEPSLQAQIDRLLATHDPHDAYRAYQLVADCAAFNANGDRVIFDQDEVASWMGDRLPGFRAMTEEEKRHDARLCAGMTERERQNRLDYLAIAARAGVGGAAIDFANEGPFGDKSALATRPDDPLVKEWKATARALLTQAAESGTDPAALQVWAAYNVNGTDFNDRNHALAYRYSVAWGLIQAELLGPGAPVSKMVAPGSDFLNGLGAELTPQQRADELAAAQAIAERARAARTRARSGG